jgi:hypothetical protein
VNLEQNEPLFMMKTRICRKYSCQKQTQFLHGNNVLHAAGSNIDGFLWRDACVSSTELNRPNWKRMSLSPPWYLWFAGSAPFKSYLNSQWEMMCYMLLLQPKLFSFKRLMYFFNLAEYTYLQQIENFSTLKTMVCRKYSFKNWLNSHR